MNNTTGSFIYYNEHNVTISEYTNAINSTTIMPRQEIYINTLSNIYDVNSLVEFYRLMFAGHPMVLLTCIFVGLYFGCVLTEYNKKRHSKQVVKK
jgi:hypothetical protein